MQELGGKEGLGEATRNANEEASDQDLSLWLRAQDALLLSPLGQDECRSSKTSLTVWVPEPPRMHGVYNLGLA